MQRLEFGRTVSFHQRHLRLPRTADQARHDDVVVRARQAIHDVDWSPDQEGYSDAQVIIAGLLALLDEARRPAVCCGGPR